LRRGRASSPDCRRPPLPMPSTSSPPARGTASLAANLSLVRCRVARSAASPLTSLDKGQLCKLSRPRPSSIGAVHHCRQNSCWRAGAGTNFDPPILIGGGETDTYLMHQSAGAIIGGLKASELDALFVEHGVIGPPEMEVVSRHRL